MESRSIRFIALHCGEVTETLLEHCPNAYLLLTQIAMRAKWKDCPITGMNAGEALIGDWKKAGLTSPKSYEVAKKKLEKWGLATFKGGNRGTVAALTNTSIFSLSTDFRGNQGEPRGKLAGTKGGLTTQSTQSTQKLERPTLDDVKAFSVEIGLPESDGESRFYSWEANEWTNKGKPVKDWKATIRAWKAAGYMPSQKNPQQAPNQPSKPGTISANGRTYRT